MKKNNRIPAITGQSTFALARWFGRITASGLLFHPDDRPENIISIETKEPTFTEEECAALNESLELLFDLHGDLVYDVALSYLQRTIGIKEPALA
jgi:hypothetical protein